LAVRAALRQDPINSRAHEGASRTVASGPQDFNIGAGAAFTAAVWTRLADRALFSPRATNYMHSADRSLKSTKAAPRSPEWLL
jgi:hypothetical protein